MYVSFGNKKLRLNIFNTLQGPLTYDHDEINMLEEVAENEMKKGSMPLDPLNNEMEKGSMPLDPLYECLAHFNVDAFDIAGYTNEENNLIDIPFYLDTPYWIEKYGIMPDLSNTPSVSSLSLVLELEPLPDLQNDNLLEPNDIYSEIIEQEV